MSGSLGPQETEEVQCLETQLTGAGESVTVHPGSQEEYLSTAGNINDAPKLIRI